MPTVIRPPRPEPAGTMKPRVTALANLTDPACPRDERTFEAQFAPSVRYPKRSPHRSFLVECRTDGGPAFRPNPLQWLVLARRHSNSPLRRSGRRSSRPATPAQPDKEAPVVFDAVVGQALPNVMFEVELEGGHKAIAYAAGRMRRYRIRITPGDRIRVELSPYDLERGRIVYRYRD